MEGDRAGDARLVSKTSGALGPGVQFCPPSAISTQRRYYAAYYHERKNSQS
jgi:hypothetical protein